MNLELSADDRRFQAEIREWVRSNLPAETAYKVHIGEPLTRAEHQGWAQILGKRGWLAFSWPEKFGGPGWSGLQKHLFDEACAMEGAPEIQPFGPVMVAPVLMAFGSAEQQARFLPGIASGETWWSQGYSEPDAGSDLASLKTVARREGSHYIVNGHKTWTSYAQYGDWMFCLARTSAEARKQDGISFLLLDMSSPGISVRPIITMDGSHVVNDVFLDDVCVPIENRIGEEGKGWTYAKHLLSYERATIARVNLAKFQLLRLKSRALRENLWDDRRFRDQIALVEVDIVALEMLVLRALLAAEDRELPLDIAGLLKIKGSEIYQRTAELLMLAAGPYSLPWAPGAAGAGWQDLAASPAGQGDWPQADAEGRWLASAYFSNRRATINAGSTEVQNNIIAKVLFG